jgi:hypothetical protein
MNLVSAMRLKTSWGSGSSRFPERARRMSASAIILLALWSGGVGCLWCCASDLPKECCDKRGAATVHNLPQACSAHRRCCEPTESNQRAAINQAPSTAAAHCCPIGAHTSGPAAFPPSQQLEALALTISQSPAPVALTLDAPPFIFHPPPANKGSTYLRCCVFLI